MFESTKKFLLLGINTLENRIEIVEKESKMRNTEKERQPAKQTTNKKANLAHANEAFHLPFHI